MAENDFRADPRWELVERVASSRQLVKAPRLRDLLLHVCRETLRGDKDALTEHQIGTSVFGRRSDYSPGDDSIVRVQARQLRHRLEEYFREDGRGEPLVIEIPKGSYVPLFREAGESSYVRPEDRNGSAAARGPSAQRWPELTWLALAATIVLVVICVVLWRQNRQLRSMTASAVSSEPPLLTSIFEPGSSVNVVVSDTSYGTFQGITGGRLRLEDYLKPGYPRSLLTEGLVPQEEARWVRAVGDREFTDFSKVLIAQRMAQLAATHGWKWSLRYARDLKMRDVAEGNQLLFGSPMSNPWIDVFEPELVFRSEWDAVNRVGLIRNMHPKPGERAVYAGGGPNGVPGAAYALVGLIDRATPSGASRRILLLKGTNQEATEAAWEFVAGPRKRGETLAGTAIPPLRPGKPYHLEILIETEALAGSPGQISVKTVYSR